MYTALTYGNVSGIHRSAVVLLTCPSLGTRWLNVRCSRNLMVTMACRCNPSLLCCSPSILTQKERRWCRWLVRLSSESQPNNRRDNSDPWPPLPLLPPGVCGWCTDTCLGAGRWCGAEKRQATAKLKQPNLDRAKPEPNHPQQFDDSCILHRLQRFCLILLSAQLTWCPSPRSGFSQRRHAHCTPTARTGLVEPIVWGSVSCAVVLQHDGTSLARCNMERQPDQLASSPPSMLTRR